MQKLDLERSLNCVRDSVKLVSAKKLTRHVYTNVYTGAVCLKEREHSVGGEINSVSPPPNTQHCGGRVTRTGGTRYWVVRRGDQKKTQDLKCEPSHPPDSKQRHPSPQGACRRDFVIRGHGGICGQGSDKKNWRRSSPNRLEAGTKPCRIHHRGGHMARRQGFPDADKYKRKLQFL